MIYQMQLRTVGLTCTRMIQLLYSSDKDPTKLGDRVEKDLGRVAVWIDIYQRAKNECGKDSVDGS